MTRKELYTAITAAGVALHPCNAADTAPADDTAIYYLTTDELTGIYAAPAEEQITTTNEEEEQTMENISAEARELGYLATQYEQYGSVDDEEIIEAYIDEKVEVDISMLGDYNNYLANDNRYDDEIMDWDELEDYLKDMPPLDAFRLAHNSDFTWNDNYFTWNGYGNLVGMEEYAVVDKIKEDRDFLKWYVTENELIDDDTMEEAINYCNHLLKEGY
jgi:hypothetical protein